MRFVNHRTVCACGVCDPDPEDDTMMSPQPRTAAATAARKTTALRRRLATMASELRTHGYIVVTRSAACADCKSMNDASATPRPRS